MRIHVSGIDLIRDEHGEMRVLEDNVRVPSGVSYVISNRRVMAQTLPELFVSMRVRPVGDYPNKLLAALRASAPPGVEEPNVVVLTPGVYNSAYFEHTLLARLMGVELVEGRDLLCAGGKVFMRTTRGPKRVDVIYRRVDDEFLDPLQFRADSMLGAPGLMLAARLGNVTIANAVGNGVADDKLLYTYVPELIRYYLSEEPILKNVDTWRLEDPGALEEVLDRLDELVVKPVDGSGGKGLVVGPDASPAELEKLRTRLHGRPARLDRAAGGHALDDPDPRRGRDAPAPRRPPPLRGQQRRRHLGAARRPDPRGAARGAARRELQPGRRIEGHVDRRRRGPRSRRVRPGQRPCRDWSPTRHPPSPPPSRSSTTSRPAVSHSPQDRPRTRVEQQEQQQQQRAAAATAGGGGARC